MELTFLGTGGSVPTPKRNTISIAFRFGPEVLLFDCGEGTQRQLMSSTVSFMRIRRIFLSHHHGDHFLGLPGLIQSMNFYGREEALDIYGPRGTGDLVHQLISLGQFELKFNVRGHDLDAGDVMGGEGYSIRAFATEHIIESLGFRFQEDERPGRFDPERAKELGVREGPSFSRLVSGLSVLTDHGEVRPDMVMGPPRKGFVLVYSGDTSPCKSLREEAIGADVLIHEATVASELGEKAREFGHSTAEEAARIAAECRVGRLFLVHLSGRYSEVAPLLEEARNVFSLTDVPEDLSVYVLSKTE